jgi:hypothetical protein
MLRISAGLFVSTFAMAGVSQVALQTGKDRPVDSGRYGFDASCTRRGAFLECRMVVRDLVYDRILGQPELSTTRMDQGGGLGSGFVFEGNPAVGKPQQFALSLNPEPDPAASGIARFLVEVREAGQLLQRYSVAFPVMEDRVPDRK